MFTALTIAGSDPSGGAGIQGDLKTFHAHGVYGMAVITSLTAQNTTGVSGVFDVPAEFVARQLEAVIRDMPIGAVKTGMLSNPAVIDAIAKIRKVSKLTNLVVDPVMVASSGDALITDDAIDALKEQLIPRATVITPNIPEAERLLGKTIDSVELMRDAVVALGDLCSWSVLLTGGHLEGDEVVDVFCCMGDIVEYRAPRIDTPHTHGTGCALSAGITAQLARGIELREAIAQARDFVRRGLEQGVALGKGNNPINHLAAGHTRSANPSTPQSR